MPDAKTGTAMIPSSSPFDAYAADLERLGRSSPIGGSDDAWLVLAHALHRCGLLTAENAQGDASRRGAANGDTLDLALIADSIAVNAVAAGLASQASLLRCARALRAISDPSIVLASGNSALTELFVATQSVAEEQEIAGAFGLAYATLKALLASFGSQASTRAKGNALSQMGRAARQLGAHDVAHELYDDAMMVGYDGDALDVVARALLGLGSLALTRGNYPKGREMFERALVNAERANDPEFVRVSHHGLFNCALASGDLDSAMVHGWNVLRLCIAPESRAEALVNMAEVCRLSGEHDAALRVYGVALEWASQPRIRAHAVSGAIQSAVALRRTNDVHRFLNDLDEIMPDVSDAYTLAGVAMERANAHRFLGDTQRANDCLYVAKSLAAKHGFHELTHRLDAERSNDNSRAFVDVPLKAPSRRTRLQRSDEYRLVLRSLRTLTKATV